MFERIDHVEIVPRDYAKAMEFYTQLLGRSKRAEIKDPDGLPIELRQW